MKIIFNYTASVDLSADDKSALVKKQEQLKRYTRDNKPNMVKTMKQQINNLIAEYAVKYCDKAEPKLTTWRLRDG